MTLLVLIEIITGLSTIVCFIIGTTVLYHGIKQQFLPNLILGVAFYVFTATVVLDFIVALLSDSDEALAGLLMNLSMIATILFLITFLVYTDRITNTTISPKTTFGLFLCGIALGMVWEEPWIRVSTAAGWTQKWNAEFTLIFLFLVLYTVLKYLLTLWVVYRETDIRQQRLVIVTVALGFIITLGGVGLIAILEVLGFSIIPKLDVYLLIIGISILGIAQIANPLALYFIRATITVCGITNEAGIPYVTYIPEGGLFDVTLGTAAIAGVQALIKETTLAEKRRLKELARDEKNIECLESGDMKVLFKYYQSADISSRVVAFLIANNDTFFLRKALSQILSSFINQYGSELDEVVYSDSFEPFKDTIEKFLSFAIPKSRIPDLKESQKAFSRLTRFLKSKNP